MSIRSAAVALALAAALAAGFASARQAHAAGEAEDGKPTSIYVSMHPHFLTNLAGGRRFVSIKAQALVNNEVTRDALTLHMPAIRHELLMMLAEKGAEDLNGVEQKQAFLDAAAGIMREVLARYADEETGAGVEGMFITSMVIQ